MNVLIYALIMQQIKYEYNDLNQKEEKKEILQPELSTYMFYGNNEKYTKN